MGNRRNSKMQKQLQISLGEVTVSTPRDRNVGYSVNVRVSNKWDYLKDCVNRKRLSQNRISRTKNL